MHYLRATCSPAGEARALDSNTTIGCRRPSGGNLQSWRDKVVELLDGYISGKKPVGDFASAYEHWWNFERDCSQQTAEEAALLQALFDVVAYYTPIVEDRAAWKGFKDEQAVTSAARRLQERFRSSAAG